MFNNELGNKASRNWTRICEIRTGTYTYNLPSIASEIIVTIMVQFNGFTQSSIYNIPDIKAATKIIHAFSWYYTTSSNAFRTIGLQVNTSNGFSCSVGDGGGKELASDQKFVINYR